MKTSRDILLVLGASVSMLWGGGALAEVFVIVNAGAPAASIDRKRLEQLYFGRARTFADGSFAVIVDRPDSTLRERFFWALGGMSLPQVNAYWARLNFTGRVLPPQVRNTDDEVLAVVRRDSNAVGYIGRDPDDASVRVVMRLE
jgi:hypothetical protein